MAKKIIKKNKED